MKGEGTLPSGGVYTKELEEICRGWGRLLSKIDTSLLPLFARIGMLAKLYEEFSEQLLSRFGVTLAEYQTLGILRTTGEGRMYSPTELAAWAHQTTAGMTKTLDRLERAGLARRRPHPTDRRRVEIVLTEEGAAVTDRIFLAQTEAQDLLMEGCDQGRKSQFNSVISELVQRFAVQTGRSD
jgi:DNA-binding MarR family transcriptional regulator